MGKTAKGALWLSPERTSPYEFYQYWRNVGDADVEKCLRMLTFLPMDEVRRLASLEGAEINKAKEILAFEVTKLVHGEEEAQKAQDGARAAFGGGASTENIPTAEYAASEFEGEGKGLLTLMTELKLAASNGEARRTIQQGGLSMNGAKVTDPRTVVTADMFQDGELLLQKGKKKFQKVVIK
jgi:tyrosyl-tRNA synthetase